MDGPEKNCAHCSIIPCDKKCSRCAKVWYCGVEHQKLHRKTHKDNCFPSIELTNDRLVHYLVSTRKILAGEIIFAEGPLILSPFVITDERSPVCLGCCQVLPGIFGEGQHGCQKCGWPLCKHDCEKISWHSENECELFRRHEVKPTDFPDLGVETCLSHIYDCINIIRILLLKATDPDKFEKALQLESHVELRKQSYAGVHQTKFALTFVIPSCKMSPTSESYELIDKLLGVVLYNTIRMGCENIPGCPREAYIFEKGSKIRHSCIPNTRSSTSTKTNTTIRQVFAVTDIEKNETLTGCYGFPDTFWKGIVERRQNLNDGYHFWCSCRRCSDSSELGTYFSAIKCKGKNCSGFYLPSNPLSTDGQDSIWKCTTAHCKITEKYSNLSKIVVAIQDEIQKSKTIEEKLSIIQKHANVSVHENHFTLMKLRFELLPKFLSILSNFVDQTHADLEYVQATTITIEFSEKCLEIANILAPGLSLLRGILLFYLSNSLQKKVGLGISSMSTEAKASDEGTMSVLNAFQAIIPIREEAKQILKFCPEGTPGQTMYQTLVDLDDMFDESPELENEKKKRETGKLRLY